MHDIWKRLFPKKPAHNILTLAYVLHVIQESKVVLFVSRLKQLACLNRQFQQTLIIHAFIEGRLILARFYGNWLYPSETVCVLGPFTARE